MSFRLPLQTTAFRSAPLRHCDSMPVQSPRGAFRRRSLSEGATKRISRTIQRSNNKVMPIDFDEGPIERPLYLGNPNAPRNLGSYKRDEKKLEVEVDHDEQAPLQQPRHGTNGHWVVTREMLEPVPKYYPLEQTAMHVRNVPVATIAKRVSEYARLHSIACRYSGTSVDCVSSQLVRFVLYLWKGAESTTIVEVQRLQGNCIELQRIRHGLFHAIETGEYDAPTSGHDHRVSLCLKRAYDEQQQKSSLSAAAATAAEDDLIRISLELLQSRRFDQNRLGMESLLVLVNSSIVGHDCAVRVCHQVLHHLSLWTAVESYVRHYNSSHQEEEDEAYYSDSNAEEYAQHSHFTDMHNLALQVLSRSLETHFMEYGATTTTMPVCNHGAVMDSLVHDVSMAQHFPQEAAMAATILSVLIDSSANSTKILKQPRYKSQHLLPIAWEAHEYGKLHHAQLETETQRLLERLAAA